MKIESGLNTGVIYKGVFEGARENVKEMLNKKENPLRPEKSPGQTMKDFQSRGNTIDFKV